MEYAGIILIVSLSFSNCALISPVESPCQRHIFKISLFISPVTGAVNAFLKDVESLNTSLLLAIQRLAKVEENRCNQSTEEGEVADSGRCPDGFLFSIKTRLKGFKNTA